jgi:hypothetical protein
VILPSVAASDVVRLLPHCANVGSPLTVGRNWSSLVLSTAAAVQPSSSWSTPFETCPQTQQKTMNSCWLQIQTMVAFSARCRHYAIVRVRMSCDLDLSGSGMPPFVTR